jgi:hypothetical protein
MSIEWTGTVALVGGRIVGSIRLRNNGYHASHLTWVMKHLKPTMKPCQTEAGIKRRVERYAQVWVVAGKPEPDGD